MGLKIHEDWGATPAVIDACLKVSDMYDVQTAIHTDTLNEAGCVEDTLNAIMVELFILIILKELVVDMLQIS